MCPKTDCSPENSSLFAGPQQASDSAFSSGLRSKRSGQAVSQRKRRLPVVEKSTVDSSYANMKAILRLGRPHLAMTIVRERFARAKALVGRFFSGRYARQRSAVVGVL
jgi:hypothetical protein